MIFEIDGKYWLVYKGGSIFTSRNGKKDFVISRRVNSLERQRLGGYSHEDGFYYTSCQRIACENGEILRDYLPVPAELNYEKLKDLF
jgi:hypothetical protein